MANKKVNDRKPIIFIALLIIVLPVLGFYLGSSRNITSEKPNPTDNFSLNTESRDLITDNWQTYTNNAIGFEFKFPANFRKLTKPGASAPLELLGSNETTGNASTDGFSIFFFPFTGTLDDLLTLRDRSKNSGNQIEVLYPDIPIKKISDVKFNGINGRWYLLGNGNYAHSDTEVEFIKNGYAFIIRPNYSSERDYDKELNNYELELLLSTFKFTK